MPGTQSPKVPEGLRDLMKSLTKEVLREKPLDLYEFSAQFFEKLIQDQKDFKVKEFEPLSEYDFFKNRERNSFPATLIYSIIPAGLTELIKDFIKAVLRQRPENICIFGVEYFRRLQKMKKNQTNHNEYLAFENYFKSKEKFVFTPYVKCKCGRTLGMTSSFNNEEDHNNCVANNQFEENNKNLLDREVMRVKEKTEMNFDEKTIKAVYIIQKFCRRYISKKKLTQIHKGKVVQEKLETLQLNGNEAQVKGKEQNLTSKSIEISKPKERSEKNENLNSLNNAKYESNNKIETSQALKAFTSTVDLDNETREHKPNGKVEVEENNSMKIKEIVDSKESNEPKAQKNEGEIEKDSEIKNMSENIDKTLEKDKNESIKLESEKPFSGKVEENEKNRLENKSDKEVREKPLTTSKTSNSDNVIHEKTTIKANNISENKDISKEEFEDKTKYTEITKNKLVNTNNMELEQTLTAMETTQEFESQSNKDIVKSSDKSDSETGLLKIATEDNISKISKREIRESEAEKLTKNNENFNDTGSNDKIEANINVIENEKVSNEIQSISEAEIHTESEIKQNITELTEKSIKNNIVESENIIQSTTKVQDATEEISGRTSSTESSAQKSKIVINKDISTAELPSKSNNKTQNSNDSEITTQNKSNDVEEKLKSISEDALKQDFDHKEKEEISEDLKFVDRKTQKENSHSKEAEEDSNKNTIEKNSSDLEGKLKSTNVTTFDNQEKDEIKEDSTFEASKTQKQNSRSEEAQVDATKNAAEKISNDLEGISKSTSKDSLKQDFDDKEKSKISKDLKSEDSKTEKDSSHSKGTEEDSNKNTIEKNTSDLEGNLKTTNETALKQEFDNQKNDEIEEDSTFEASKTQKQNSYSEVAQEDPTKNATEKISSDLKGNLKSTSKDSLKQEFDNQEKGEIRENSTFEANKTQKQNSHSEEAQVDPTKNVAEKISSDLEENLKSASKDSLKQEFNNPEKGEISKDLKIEASKFQKDNSQMIETQEDLTKNVNDNDSTNLEENLNLTNKELLKQVLDDEEKVEIPKDFESEESKTENKNEASKIAVELDEITKSNTTIAENEPNIKEGNNKNNEIKKEQENNGSSIPKIPIPVIDEQKSNESKIAPSQDFANESSSNLKSIKAEEHTNTLNLSVDEKLRPKRSIEEASREYISSLLLNENNEKGTKDETPNEKAAGLDASVGKNLPSKRSLEETNSQNISPLSLTQDNSGETQGNTQVPELVSSSTDSGSTTEKLLTANIEEVPKEILESTKLTQSTDTTKNNDSKSSTIQSNENLGKTAEDQSINETAQPDLLKEKSNDVLTSSKLSKENKETEILESSKLVQLETAKFIEAEQNFSIKTDKPDIIKGKMAITENKPSFEKDNETKNEKETEKHNEEILIPNKTIITDLENLTKTEISQSQQANLLNSQEKNEKDNEMTLNQTDRVKTDNENESRNNIKTTNDILNKSVENKAMDSNKAGVLDSSKLGNKDNVESKNKEITSNDTTENTIQNDEKEIDKGTEVSQTLPSDDADNSNSLKGIFNNAITITKNVLTMTSSKPSNNTSESNAQIEEPIAVSADNSAPSVIASNKSSNEFTAEQTKTNVSPILTDKNNIKINAKDGEMTKDENENTIPISLSKNEAIDPNKLEELSKNTEISQTDLTLTKIGSEELLESNAGIIEKDKTPTATIENNEDQKNITVSPTSTDEDIIDQTNVTVSPTNNEDIQKNNLEDISKTAASMKKHTDETKEISAAETKEKTNLTMENKISPERVTEVQAEGTVSPTKKENTQDNILEDISKTAALTKRDSDETKEISAAETKEKTNLKIENISPEKVTEHQAEGTVAPINNDNTLEDISKTAALTKRDSDKTKEISAAEAKEKTNLTIENNVSPEKVTEVQAGGTVSPTNNKNIQNNSLEDNVIAKTDDSVESENNSPSNITENQTKVLASPTSNKDIQSNTLEDISTNVVSTKDDSNASEEHGLQREDKTNLEVNKNENHEKIIADHKDEINSSINNKDGDITENIVPKKVDSNASKENTNLTIDNNENSKIIAQQQTMIPVSSTNNKDNHSNIQEGISNNETQAKTDTNENKDDRTQNEEKDNSNISINEINGSPKKTHENETEVSKSSSNDLTTNSENFEPLVKATLSQGKLLTEDNFDNNTQKGRRNNSNSLSSEGEKEKRNNPKSLSSERDNSTEETEPKNQTLSINAQKEISSDANNLPVLESNDAVNEESKDQSKTEGLQALSAVENMDIDNSKANLAILESNNIKNKESLPNKKEGSTEETQSKNQTLSIDAQKEISNDEKNLSTQESNEPSNKKSEHQSKTEGSQALSAVENTDIDTSKENLESNNIINGESLPNKRESSAEEKQLKHQTSHKDSVNDAPSFDEESKLKEESITNSENSLEKQNEPVVIGKQSAPKVNEYTNNAEGETISRKLLDTNKPISQNESTKVKQNKMPNKNEKLQNVTIKTAPNTQNEKMEKLKVEKVESKQKLLKEKDLTGKELERNSQSERTLKNMAVIKEGSQNHDETKNQNKELIKPTRLCQVEGVRNDSPERKYIQYPIAEIYLKSFRVPVEQNLNKDDTLTISSNQKSMLSSTSSDVSHQGNETEFSDSLNDENFERDSLEVNSPRETDIEEDSFETENKRNKNIEINVNQKENLLSERMPTYLYGLETTAESAASKEKQDANKKQVEIKKSIVMFIPFENPKKSKIKNQTKFEDSSLKNSVLEKSNDLVEIGINKAQTESQIEEIPNDFAENDDNDDSPQEGRLQTIFEQNEIESPRLDEVVEINELKLKDNKSPEESDTNIKIIEEEDNNKFNSNDLITVEINNDHNRNNIDLENQIDNIDSVHISNHTQPTTMNLLKEENIDEPLDSYDTMSTLSDNELSESSTFTTSKEFDETVLSDENYNVMKNLNSKPKDQKLSESADNTPKGGIYEIDPNNLNVLLQNQQLSESVNEEREIETLKINSAQPSMEDQKTVSEETETKPQEQLDSATKVSDTIINEIKLETESLTQTLKAIKKEIDKEEMDETKLETEQRSSEDDKANPSKLKVDVEEIKSETENLIEDFKNIKKETNKEEIVETKLETEQRSSEVDKASSSNLNVNVEEIKSETENLIEDFKDIKKDIDKEEIIDAKFEIEQTNTQADNTSSNLLKATTSLESKEDESDVTIRKLDNLKETEKGVEIVNIEEIKSEAESLTQILKDAKKDIDKEEIIDTQLEVEQTNSEDNESNPSNLKATASLESKEDESDVTIRKSESSEETDKKHETVNVEEIKSETESLKQILKDAKKDIDKEEIIDPQLEIEQANSKDNESNPSNLKATASLESKEDESNVTIRKSESSEETDKKRETIDVEEIKSETESLKQILKDIKKDIDKEDTNGDTKLEIKQISSEDNKASSSDLKTTTNLVSRDDELDVTIRKSDNSEESGEEYKTANDEEIKSEIDMKRDIDKEDTNGETKVEIRHMSSEDNNASPDNLAETEEEYKALNVEESEIERKERKERQNIDENNLKESAPIEPTQETEINSLAEVLKKVKQPISDLSIMPNSESRKSQNDQSKETINQTSPKHAEKHRKDAQDKLTNETEIEKLNDLIIETESELKPIIKSTSKSNERIEADDSLQNNNLKDKNSTQVNNDEDIQKEVKNKIYDINQNVNLVTEPNTSEIEQNLTIEENEISKTTKLNENSIIEVLKKAPVPPQDSPSSTVDLNENFNKLNNAALKIQKAFKNYKIKKSSKLEKNTTENHDIVSNETEPTIMESNKVNWFVGEEPINSKKITPQQLQSEQIGTLIIKHQEQNFEQAPKVNSIESNDVSVNSLKNNKTSNELTSEEKIVSAAALPVTIEADTLEDNMKPMEEKNESSNVAVEGELVSESTETKSLEDNKKSEEEIIESISVIAENELENSDLNGKVAAVSIEPDALEHSIESMEKHNEPKKPTDEAKLETTVYNDEVSAEPKAVSIETKSLEDNKSSKEEHNKAIRDAIEVNPETNDHNGKENENTPLEQTEEEVRRKFALNETQNFLDSQRQFSELQISNDIKNTKPTVTETTTNKYSEIELTRSFLTTEIEYSTEYQEIIEEQCIKKSISQTELNEFEIETETENKTEAINSDEEVKDIAVEQILQKPEEFIEKMQRRRSIEIDASPISSAGKSFEQASFDDPVIKTLESIVGSRNSTAEDSDEVVIMSTDNINQTTKSYLKKTHTIASSDPRSLFKSVTIDETIKYIELTTEESETSITTSNESFCLDEDTSENIRKKMMAYSLSEADSDQYNSKDAIYGESFDGPHDDFNINTALKKDETTSTDTESTIISAATKIQAGARGFLTRRRLRRTSVGSKSTYNDGTLESFGNNAINESLETMIEDEAAKKIQKAYRNHRQNQFQSMEKFSENYSHESSLAAKRLTLQRGDALRINSSPEEDNGNNDNLKSEKAKVMPTSSKGSKPKADEAIKLKKSNNFKSNELKWLTLRQNSMPVQIDSEVFRVIPKHMRKKTNSAEGSKKRGRRVQYD